MAPFDQHVGTDDDSPVGGIHHGGVITGPDLYTVGSGSSGDEPVDDGELPHLPERGARTVHHRVSLSQVP